MPRRKRKKPLPGFPRKGKFQSKEEVDSYYAGEKIQCLLCGRWYRSICGTHLPHIHGIHPEAYKEMYGLPWGRGLNGTLTRKKRVKQAKRLRTEGKLKNLPKKFRGGKAAHSKPFQPYQINRIITQGLLVQGKIKQYRRDDYQRILKRMRNENRILNDVCGDPDVPCKTSWKCYVKEHPELNERVHRIQHSLPYPLQTRANDLSPRFSLDCRRLRARGDAVPDIAAALGVSSGTVIKALKETTPDYCRLKPGIESWIWQPKDYELILDRMRRQQRSLRDVCKDPDLPSIESVLRIVNIQPEFEIRIREIQHRFPYTLQAKTSNFSPRLAIDCLRLRNRRMSLKTIGIALGVSSATVSRALQKKRDSGRGSSIIDNEKAAKGNFPEG